MKLTIKTLDSRNHEFDVEGSMTVAELKSHISASVGVSADEQRLIFCGRVLQDTKSLSEYALGDRVVHLVQRAPPASRAPLAQPTSAAATTTSGAGTRPHRYTAGMEMRATSSSSGVRLSQARDCVRMIRHVLECLDNKRPLPDIHASSGAATSQQRTGATIINSATSPAASMSHAVSSAVNHAMQNARAAFSNGQLHVQMHTVTNPLIANSSGPPSTSAPLPSGEQMFAMPSNSSMESIVHPTTGEYLQVLDELCTLYERFQPYLRHYRQLLADGDDVASDAELTAQQRHEQFVQITEVLHYISHAFHACSDMQMDFSQTQRPRVLRARPIVFAESHHIATATAAIPIVGTSPLTMMGPTQTPGGTSAAPVTTSASQESSGATQSAIHEQSQPMDVDIQGVHIEVEEISETQPMDITAAVTASDISYTTVTSDTTTSQLTHDHTPAPVAPPTASTTMNASTADDSIINNIMQVLQSSFSTTRPSRVSVATPTIVTSSSGGRHVTAVLNRVPGMFPAPARSASGARATVGGAASVLAGTEPQFDPFMSCSSWLLPYHSARATSMQSGVSTSRAEDASVQQVSTAQTGVGVRNTAAASVSLPAASLSENNVSTGQQHEAQTHGDDVCVLSDPLPSISGDNFTVTTGRRLTPEQLTASVGDYCDQCITSCASSSTPEWYTQLPSDWASVVFADHVSITHQSHDSSASNGRGQFVATGGDTCSPLSDGYLTTMSARAVAALNRPAPGMTPDRLVLECLHQVCASALSDTDWSRVHHCLTTDNEAMSRDCRQYVTARARERVMRDTCFVDAPSGRYPNIEKYLK